MKKFYEMEIWRKGYALLMRVYKLTSRYPSQEKFGLVTQTNRSANSIIANTAEAHGRYYYKDKIKSLFQARCECEETQSHLLVAKGLQYALAEEIDSLVADYEELMISINAWISDLHEQDMKQKSNKSPDSKSRISDL